MFRKILLLLIPTLSFANGPIEVGFSPNKGSADLVLKVINSAKISICMATYSFTSAPVAKALLAAQKRGVSIKIISDDKGNDNKYTATRFLSNQSLNVRLNNHYPIMHNKFIIVDQQTVETGSYNYSSGANKNAENVLVMWNYPDVAAKYSAECNRLYNEGQDVPKSY